MPKRKSSNQLLKQRLKALEKRLGSMGLLSAALAIQVNGSARVGGFEIACDVPAARAIDFAVRQRERFDVALSKR